jgi:preprotein translocase subunit SecY
VGADHRWLHPVGAGHATDTVQFAKRVQGNKQYGGVRNYIPLKVNAAGVMPIIFAQAIVLIPMYVGTGVRDATQLVGEHREQPRASSTTSRCS